MSKDGSSKILPSVSLAAGGAAGAVEAAVTYPLEFAKTRMQLGTVKTRNPFIIINHVVRTEGLPALYKGFPNVIIGSMGKNAIRFVSFDAIKNVWKDAETGELTPARSLLAGMSAGVVTSIFAVTPTQRVKTAIIDDGGGAQKFRSSMHAARMMYQERGLAAFYYGFGGTTLKAISATAVRMGTYNILKDYEHSRNIRPTMSTSFMNGAIAGIVTTYATQPFDTLKTRCQSANGASTVEAFKNIMADGGIRVFWSGSVVRLGRTILSGGIFVAVLNPILSLK
ncbi:mitochondrial carrier domain-containing protein [Fomitopsis serialis]|uniref:mitochondrial carrier domain-containing protein n=1 Tax=Fomitopsis serialis TaxID=139415 RepID=UPI0020085939|nr:mitochondrial carrier domain-containing protein [Neoantrodia serialis]KAH9928165.1 mitochondrial carrier domain-containing protein [Neoantrodia serialis]